MNSGGGGGGSNPVPPVKEGCFFGVFDGHGGHEVAEYLRKELPQSVERCKQQLLDGPDGTQFRREKRALLNEALKRGFEGADQGLVDITKANPKLRSGSCAVVALIDNDLDSIFVANVGDSKAVLATVSPTNPSHVVPVPLSSEHNCKNEREKELVRKRTKDPHAIRSTTVSASEFAKALAEQKHKHAEEIHSAKGHSARDRAKDDRQNEANSPEETEEADDQEEEEQEEEEEDEEEEEEEDDRFLDEFESKAWDSDDEPFDTQALINLILKKPDHNSTTNDGSKPAEAGRHLSPPNSSKRRSGHDKKSRSRHHHDEDDEENEDEDEDGGDDDRDEEEDEEDEHDQEETDEEENESESEEEDVQPAPQPERVAGCLMVTRAFGDLFLKYPELSYRPFVHFVPYITCEPEIVVHDSTCRDRFLVVASDGLWELFSDQQVVDLIHSFEQQYYGGSKGLSSSVKSTPSRSVQSSNNNTNKQLSDKEFSKALTDHLTRHFFERVAEDKGVDVDFLHELTPEQRRYAFDDTTAIIVFFKSTELPKQ